MKKSGVKLSQCMIVKNEEKNIERALSWGKKIVFEQIVVDTGSTDRTVEIAEKMGAKVYHYVWNDDFSAAKNYALEQAKGNWIAFLDADEYLSEKDAKRIHEIMCHVEKNIPEAKRPHILRGSLVDLGEDGSPENITVQDRFFKNIKQLRYYNRIHEQIRFPAGIELRVAGIEDEISIFHTGYTKTAYKETGKLNRNIDLLKQELKDHPGNYDTMVYLGESMSANGQKEEAIDIFWNIFCNGFDTLDERQRGHTIWGLMNLIVENMSDDMEKRFETIYQKGIQSDTKYPDFDYFKGYRSFLKENWQATIIYLETSIKKLEKYDGPVTVYMAGKMELVYTALLKSYLECGQTREAVKYAVTVLRMDKYMEPVLNTLLDLLKKDGTRAEDCHQFLLKIYDSNNLKDKLVLRKCARTVGYFELDEWIKAHYTEEERKILDGLQETGE